MRVHILFKDFSMGFLAEHENGYAWVPNDDVLAMMKQRHPLTLELFLLPHEPCLFRNVPSHFDEYLEASNRADLKEKAGIKNSDSDFERLFKMGFLEYFSEDFVIRSEK